MLMKLLFQPTENRAMRVGQFAQQGVLCTGEVIPSLHLDKQQLNRTVLSADGLTAQTRRGCGSRARRCSRGVGVQALSARTLAPRWS